MKMSTFGPMVCLVMQLQSCLIYVISVPWPKGETCKWFNRIFDDADLLEWIMKAKGDWRQRQRHFGNEEHPFVLPIYVDEAVISIPDSLFMLL
jgi:hypothetical protein